MLVSSGGETNSIDHKLLDVLEPLRSDHQRSIRDFTSGRKANPMAIPNARSVI